MQQVVPVIQNGDYANKEFSGFFKLLQMQNIFTWDMRSSEYYLTQKMLGESPRSSREYNVIQQMIFGETIDYFEKEYDPKHIVLNSRGKKVEAVQEEKRTKYFIANLSWLAFRTIFYTIIANQVGGNLILNPIRDAFQINYLNSIDRSFSATYSSIIRKMDSDADDMIRQIHSVTDPIVLKYRLPMFSIYLRNKARSIQDMIILALHIKEEGRFVNARKKMDEIELLYKNEKPGKALREANKLLLEMTKTLNEIGEKYYIKTSQGIPLSPIIQTYNVAAGLSANTFPQMPNLNISSKLLGQVKKSVPKSGFNAVYKSVVHDLAEIGKIGSYYEELIKEVSYDDRVGYYSAKVELTKYKDLDCGWKKPMNGYI